ncbi:F-box protein CPR1-like [Rutidosis leptorrhynchoides]|uniref:F-box protein CPR1-like n=1 Tax=Rutidosis leptorrhynchoides TaxID=125765 RepID=UPI003A9A168F
MSIMLPRELITEILSRLPVKSLHRFRCVSKPFRNEIDSRNFVNYHLSQLLNTNLSHVFNDLDIINTFELESLDDNPMTRESDISIDPLGFCNGLLYFLPTTSLYQKTPKIVLFNPTTREHRILHDSGLKKKFHRINYCYGFGYGSVTEDYKVVMICSSNKRLINRSNKILIMLYSFKLSCWMIVENDYIPFSFWVQHNSAPFISSNIHFRVTPKSIINTTMNHMAIAGFDLADEQFNFVPLPMISGETRFNMAVLRGCLCVTSSWCGTINHDIWILKEYEVNQSWTKLLSIRLISANVPRGSWETNCPAFIPIAYSKNGDRVLLKFCRPSYGRRLCWYDLIEKEFGFTKVLRELTHLFSGNVITNI